MLSNTSRFDANRTAAYNALGNIAAEIQNSDPNDFDYIEWGSNGVLHFDGSFNLLDNSTDAAASCIYESKSTKDDTTGLTYYTVDLKNFILTGQTDKLIEDITISSSWR